MSWPKPLVVVIEHFGTFLHKLLRTWLFWASAVATVIFWLVALWPEAPISIPTPLAWLLIYMFLVVAAFQVWRNEYLRAQELQSEDADVRLEPISEPGLTVFKLPKSYQLFHNLVPPKVWLLVNFQVVNRGGKSGSLTKMNALPPPNGGELGIGFRGEGLYPHYEEKDWHRRPISLPLPLEPERPQKVSFLLSATTDSCDPESFAKQLRRVSDSSLEFVWVFKGWGEPQERRLTVKVQFDKLKRGVYGQWMLEDRQDLIDIAQQPPS